MADLCVEKPCAQASTECCHLGQYNLMQTLNIFTQKFYSILCAKKIVVPRVDSTEWQSGGFSSSHDTELEKFQLRSQLKVKGPEEPV